MSWIESGFVREHLMGCQTPSDNVVETRGFYGANNSWRVGWGSLCEDVIYSCGIKIHCMKLYQFDSGKHHCDECQKRSEQLYVLAKSKEKARDCLDVGACPSCIAEILANNSRDHSTLGYSYEISAVK
ncbi:MAG: hypothetical protein J07HQX50_01017 [Haloquadratum sp. J07HQX50]|nr:MAG: hypothetical protein J07HQX50_01017 [Haloquadratum sp. J07HQX50]